jgi:hypothetical protein
VQNVLCYTLQSKNTKRKIHKTILLSVFLHGREAWSLTLSEEDWRRVSENRVLRRIFGPKRDKVMEE